MAKQSFKHKLHSFGDLRSHFFAEERKREIQERLAHSEGIESLRDSDAQRESGITYKGVRHTRDEAGAFRPEASSTSESDSTKEDEGVTWDRTFSTNGNG